MLLINNPEQTVFTLEVETAVFFSTHVGDIGRLTIGMAPDQEELVLEAYGLYRDENPRLLLPDHHVVLPHSVEVTPLDVAQTEAARKTAYSWRRISNSVLEAVVRPEDTALSGSAFVPVPVRRELEHQRKLYL
jgi:hypothetical protein